MGLFWRRRHRMSITWRISSSRPSTGSIRPARARAVRSIVKRASAAPLPDGAPGAAGAGVSTLPAVSASKSRRSTSANRSRRAGTAWRRRAAAASSSSQAASRWPARISPASYSTDAISQADLTAATTSGANVGLRPLPVCRRSSAALRPAVARPVIDAAMVEDLRQIAVRQIEELQHPVLDLDAEMRARQRSPRGRFQCAPARWIEPFDQFVQVDPRHRRLSSRRRLRGRDRWMASDVACAKCRTARVMSRRRDVKHVRGCGRRVARRRGRAVANGPCWRCAKLQASPAIQR